MRTSRCLAFALVFPIAGCSMLPYGAQVKAVADQAAVTAVKDRREFNDQKLQLSLAAVCDNSLGSVLRLENQRAREGLFAICGGDESAVTAEQLIGLARAIDELQAGQ